MKEKAIIMSCQGPPRCPLKGAAAVKAQKKDCLWCKRITIWEDGSETITEPVYA